MLKEFFDPGSVFVCRGTGGSRVIVVDCPMVKISPRLPLGIPLDLFFLEFCGSLKRVKIVNTTSMGIRDGEMGVGNFLVIFEVNPMIPQVIPNYP